MGSALAIDLEAIGRICSSRHVQRLSVFGSAVGADFDPEHSDVDVLVEFAPGTEDPFDAYFGLKEDLERLLGRDVDVVMTSAITNPHFAASARASTRELYAA